MSGKSWGKLTDLVAYSLSVSLAAVCLAFAAYKVVVLNSLENPPANMGLSFPAPKRRVITDEPVKVDSMTTGTITRDSPGHAPSVGRPAQPYSDESPIQDYRLLTVIDGVAFVEVLTLRGRDIVPVSPGTVLPGAGRVDRVERSNGRWTLVAGGVKLMTERQ